MSAVEVTISGMLYDKLSRSSRPVTIIGEAILTGLEIGGGPTSPGQGGGPVDPGYGRPGWSPVDPGYGRPDWGGEHPGNRPPGTEHPGNRPPGTEHPGGGPIIPPIPSEPPSDGESKPPPEQGGWGYWADEVNSWVYKPAPDEAQPK
jgi:hypothetical protein